MSSYMPGLFLVIIVQMIELAIVMSAEHVQSDQCECEMLVLEACECVCDRGVNVCVEARKLVG